MKRHQLFALAAVALVACVDGGRSSGPNFAISDAAHGGGTPGFYFLPPMVPQPTISEPFNAFLQPLVRICPLVDVSGVDEVQCPAAPIRFTRTTGMGSETIRVSALDKHYIVNWHTDQPPAVEPEQRYRIEIFGDPDGTVLLGFADVKIAATGKEAMNITNGSEGETIGLVDGKTLAIKFFAGLGALGQCDPDGPTCAEAIVSPEDGGLVVAVNADGEAEAFADFPNDWANEPVTVKLERLPNTPGPLGAPAGLHQWPLFYEFQAFVSDGERGLVPAGQFARRVRIGVCNIDNPLGDPDHPEDRGTISLGIGGEGEFRTLPLVDATDILGLCEGITLAVRADASGWRAFLARAAAVATQVVLPRPLHASAAVVVDGGMGGSTDSFSSPVGTVKGRPDLVVESFTISPASPTTIDVITFTAVIRNIGDLHAGLTFAGIDVGGEPAPGQTFECPISDGIASLAPGEACTVTRQVVLDVAQNYLAIARADAVGDLATESNEGNNERSLSFTVSPGGIDLVSVDLSSTTLTIDGQSVSYTATVRNGTASTLETVVLQAWIDQGDASRAAGGLQVLCGAGVGTLPPGPCSFDFGASASNAPTTAGTGTLVPGSATARFELKQGGTVFDVFRVPVTLVP